MKSIDFPEANIAIAKDQPQYNTLYCHLGMTPERPMICKMELTDEEIEYIVKNRHVFYSQFTFGMNFQPMQIMTIHPFSNPVVEFQPPLDENRIPAKEWDSLHFNSGLEPNVQINVNAVCLNCNKKWSEHFFSSRQCKL